jgi:hypothetical protein
MPTVPTVTTYQKNPSARSSPNNPSDSAAGAAKPLVSKVLGVLIAPAVLF